MCSRWLLLFPPSILWLHRWCDCKENSFSGFASPTQICYQPMNSSIYFQILISFPVQWGVVYVSFSLPGWFFSLLIGNPHPTFPSHTISVLKDKWQGSDPFVETLQFHDNMCSNRFCQTSSLPVGKPLILSHTQWLAGQPKSCVTGRNSKKNCPQIWPK